MPHLPSVPVAEKVDRAIFENEIKPLGQPVILKGLAGTWDCVERAAQSPRALGDYLKTCDTGRPLGVSICPAAFEGRFFYNADVTGFNFTNTERTLTQFVEMCLTGDSGDAFYLQAAPVEQAAPGLAGGLGMPLLDAAAPPRLWLGNSLRTQTHFDQADNIAVHVAGEKVFTLFPPDQVANLYPGPIELTPAGVPISMVPFDAPDFERYPRFRQALDVAQEARLEPGDALYIPVLWWHHVATTGPLNMLVNYWWSERRPDTYSPVSALYMAALSYRHMPEAERQGWSALLDYFIFESAGDPVAHLPPHARSLFADDLSSAQMEKFKAVFRRAVKL